MKVKDIENIQMWLEELKEFANKQDYNSFTYINQRLIKILPILETEYNRLVDNDMELDFPKIMIFTNLEAKQNKMTVQEYINFKLKELVINGCKIIDYGKLDEEYNDDNSRLLYFYIKYSS